MAKAKTKGEISNGKSAISNEKIVQCFLVLLTIILGSIIVLLNSNESGLIVISPYFLVEAIISLTVGISPGDNPLIIFGLLTGLVVVWVVVVIFLITSIMSNKPKVKIILLSSGLTLSLWPAVFVNVSSFSLKNPSNILYSIFLAFMIFSVISWFIFIVSKILGGNRKK